MLIYAPNHLCTYTLQTQLSEFVLPKQSLNNCTDRISMVIDMTIKSRLWNRGWPNNCFTTTHRT